MRLPKLPSPVDVWALAREEGEAQAARWVLWSPVALGGGAAVYFALRVEPSSWLTLAILAAAVGAAYLSAWRSTSRALSLAMMLLAIAAGGFAVAKARTLAVAGPIVPVSKPYGIEAFVVDIASPGATGARLILAPVSISGLPPDKTPGRIRVTVPAENLPAPGSAVRLYAIIGPPPPPASPGAYDFGRDAFFDGIGAVGFTRDAPEDITLGDAPWRLRLLMGVNAVRWDLAGRIAAASPAEARGLATAMTTGHEAWLDPDDETALRNSGLAHIISISGVHMAIVGGAVFFAARALIALWPWLALRINGKKVAALVGLTAVGGYLIISGAPAPAVRAAITASTAFVAILFDRRAITLHALAVSALVILLMQPEAVMAPGFQMSFAATAALVALFEAWPRPVREINTPWPIRLIQGGGAWIALSLGASFVAGVATGPFALQHFNRVATYGLAANLITEPVSSFVIMPFLALGGVLESFGAGAVALWVAGQGIAFLNAVARYFASLPGATFLAASAPTAALPVAFVGILFMCLWKGKLRWLGLPLALAINLWPRPPAPDVWIAYDGSAAAVRQGRLALALRPGAQAFATDLWSRHRGLTLADGAEGRDCNRLRCLADSGPPPRVAGWWTARKPSAAQIAVLCQGADVVVIKANMTAACPGALVLTGADFARGGAAELYRTRAGWKIVWAQTERGLRPWSSSGTGG